MVKEFAVCFSSSTSAWDDNALHVIDMHVEPLFLELKVSFDVAGSICPALQ
jgi:hypothetical protein